MYILLTIFSIVFFSVILLFVIVLELAQRHMYINRNIICLNL